MQWYELAENPRAISEIYTVVPPLRELHLEEVRFDEDGSRITLMFGMTVFPEKMPTRWQQRGYNALTLQLDFWIIKSVQVTRWSKENVVDVHIHRTMDGQIEAQILSPTCHIQLVAYGFGLALHKRVHAVK